MACIATVILARALGQDSGLVRPGEKGGADGNKRIARGGDDHRHDNGVVINIIADSVAVEGVISACLPEIKAATGAAVTTRQIRGDWESRLAVAESVGDRRLGQGRATAAGVATRSAGEDGEGAGSGGGESLVARVDPLVSVIAMVSAVTKYVCRRRRVTIRIERGPRVAGRGYFRHPYAYVFVRR